MSDLPPAAGRIPKAVAAVLAAAAMAVPLIAKFEGFVPVGYRDPAPGAYETICYGHMQPGVFGKRASDQECADLLAADAVKHGLEIDRCITVPVPLPSRAAFTSFAFNAGSRNFCTSTMARKLNAGDLAGACAELSRWTRAGTKTLPGLVRRRAEERALCERGVADLRPAL